MKLHDESLALANLAVTSSGHLTILPIHV